MNGGVMKKIFYILMFFLLSFWESRFVAAMVINHNISSLNSSLTQPQQLIGCPVGTVPVLDGIGAPFCQCADGYTGTYNVHYNWPDEATCKLDKNIGCTNCDESNGLHIDATTGQCVCDRSRGYAGTAPNCTLCSAGSSPSGDGLTCVCGMGYSGVSGTPSVCCKNGMGLTYSATLGECVCDVANGYAGTDQNCTHCATLAPGSIPDPSGTACICDTANNFAGVYPTCTDCTALTPGSIVDSNNSAQCICDASNGYAGTAGFAGDAATAPTAPTCSLCSSFDAIVNPTNSAQCICDASAGYAGEPAVAPNTPAYHGLSNCQSCVSLDPHALVDPTYTPTDPSTAFYCKCDEANDWFDYDPHPNDAVLSCAQACYDGTDGDGCLVPKPDGSVCDGVPADQCYEIIDPTNPNADPTGTNPCLPRMQDADGDGVYAPLVVGDLSNFDFAQCGAPDMWDDPDDSPLDDFPEDTDPQVKEDLAKAVGFCISKKPSYDASGNPDPDSGIGMFRMGYSRIYTNAYTAWPQNKPTVGTGPEFDTHANLRKQFGMYGLKCLMCSEHSEFPGAGPTSELCLKGTIGGQSVVSTWKGLNECTIRTKRVCKGFRCKNVQVEECTNITWAQSTEDECNEMCYFGCHMDANGKPITSEAGSPPITEPTRCPVPPKYN